MHKIKVAGSLAFILLIVLAFLSNYITTKNRINSSSINKINEQKAFTQEISKSIFYLYKNRERTSKQLDSSIRKFLKNMDNQGEFLGENHTIVPLWNQFYAEVQKFRDQQKVITAYSSIVTEKIVNNIYHMNLSLILEFDKLIAKEQIYYHQMIDGYKKIEYALFVILILLLIYLFTQIREIIAFIQKFSKTSKKIIENSTIQGLKPIEERIKQQELKEATDNYNHLVKKVNHSIEYSSQSMEQTVKSLEKVANNIEEFMNLLYIMQDDKSDKLFEKEDAVIDSLEELMRLRRKLKNLQSALDRLTNPSI